MPLAAHRCRHLLHRRRPRRLPRTCLRMRGVSAIVACLDCAHARLGHVSGLYNSRCIVVIQWLPSWLDRDVGVSPPPPSTTTTHPHTRTRTCCAWCRCWRLRPGGVRPSLDGRCVRSVTSAHPLDKAMLPPIRPPLPPPCTHINADRCPHAHATPHYMQTPFAVGESSYHHQCQHPGSCAKRALHLCQPVVRFYGLMWCGHCWSGILLG